MIISADIGGTLCKVCILSKTIEEHENFRKRILDYSFNLDDKLTIYNIGETTAHSLHFLSFPARPNIDDFLSFLKYIGLFDFLIITGGGSVKFHEEIQNSVPNESKIYIVDEMKANSSGVLTLIRISNYLGLTDFFYTFDVNTMNPEPIDLSDAENNIQLVSIGSGVSIVKLTWNNQTEFNSNVSLNSPLNYSYKRVSGSPVGGGTAIGLARLLLKRPNLSFSDLMELSENGDSRNVDLSINDLLLDEDRMNGLSKHGLEKDTLASSFGKLFTLSPIKLVKETDSGDTTGSIVREEDIASSIIHMVSYNIGYISSLIAQIESVNIIVYCGKYINHHEPSMKSITYAVSFYQDHFINNGGKRRAVFIRHEGYVGTIGALFTILYGEEIM